MKKCWDEDPLKRPSSEESPQKKTMDTYWLERDFGGGGWIHSVAFSPSGEALAFAGHDSEISIAYPGVLLKTLVMGESTAFNRFHDWDSKGRGGIEDSELNTIHQNTSIRHYAGNM
ncbi:unnamed protein product [Rhizophagus irregularis]|nr:unnamed protein product [Rhizophagus irregularis]CAB5182394.1 unnamed protein product [Rhizophagus irregularis]CAB5365549.1 unnamed protein product [Rhizophagus irregularis]